MKKIAFVFPGQGSQYVMMGLEFFRKYETAAKIFKQAESVLDRPVLRLCFEGPPEELAKTENAQVSIFLVDYIAGHLLIENGVEPAALAGHSLGEYAAVAISGALDFETALKLVEHRAESMSLAAKNNPGQMWAIIGLSAEAVVEALAAYKKYSVANYNCPGQIIISGEGTNFTELESALTAAGAKKIIALKVSGAFHSPAMAEAENEMAEILSSTRFMPAAVPIYSNVNAQPVSDPEKIRENLAKQICGSVRWDESIRMMISDGISIFVEAGPDTILSGLIKRIDPDVTLFHTENPASLKETMEQLGGKTTDG